MADVKLCDKCGQMFNPRGAWQSLTAATFRVDEDGVQRRSDTSLELCGICAIDPQGAERQPVMQGALATGRQLVEVDDRATIGRDADDTFHVRLGDSPKWIGPFSNLASARRWRDGESGSVPVDADEEARS